MCTAPFIGKLVQEDYAIGQLARDVIHLKGVPSLREVTTRSNECLRDGSVGEDRDASLLRRCDSPRRGINLPGFRARGQETRMPEFDHVADKLLHGERWPFPVNLAQIELR